MSHPFSTQAERLREALGETRVSRRELARAMEPEGASNATITSTKSQIAKWLSGKPGISDRNAERISDAFAKLGHSYSRDHFKRDPAGRRTMAQEMEIIAERTLATSESAYQEEMRRLRQELSEMREQEQARHRELLEELRRLREAS